MRRTVLYTRLPGCATADEAHAWAEARGVVVQALYVGPDGLLRGLAVDPDTAVRDLVVRAQEVVDAAVELRELAEECW